MPCADDERRQPQRPAGGKTCPGEELRAAGGLEDRLAPNSTSVATECPSR
jgi:hypothetical protein